MVSLFILKVVICIFLFEYTLTLTLNLKLSLVSWSFSDMIIAKWLPLFWWSSTFFCTLDIQMSNESIVHLKTVTDIDFSKLVTLGDMKVAAADFDMVHQLEKILLQWYKQIEQVDNFFFVCYFAVTDSEMCADRKCS